VSCSQHSRPIGLPLNPIECEYYQEAGIRKKASVHTLRHTFATHQIHNGVKINQLKEVLGHRKMETTYKYVHLDRTNLRAEMEQESL
jgi:site-specific recombinase XerD